MDFAVKNETFIPPIMRRRWREITGRAMSDNRMDGETLSTLAMQNNVYRVMPHFHVARFSPRPEVPVYNILSINFQFLNWQKFSWYLESYVRIIILLSLYK